MTSLNDSRYVADVLSFGDERKFSQLVSTYFLLLSRVSMRVSASSLVLTLSNTGVGGGSESGSGKQTNITVFLFMRFVGIEVVNNVFSNKFPRELSARTIS